MSVNAIKTPFGNAKIDKFGYFTITSKKEGNYGKRLHRLIFEDFYNIKLDEEFPNGIDIHHNDGNKTNNEIWNLVPSSREDHTSIHHKGKVLLPVTREKIREYQKKYSSEEITSNEDPRVKKSKKLNSTGYYGVYKENADNPQGFRWRYCVIRNGKKIQISRADINSLKNEVIKRGLTWINYSEGAC